MTLQYTTSASAIFICSTVSCYATLSTYARNRLSRVIAPCICAAFGIGALTPTASLARAAHPRHQLAVWCQQEYQNGWQQDVGNSDVWRRCGNFNSQIGQTDNVDFYYNLHGAKTVLEKTSDNCGTGCGAADAVDLLYMNTHSGVNATAAFWAMWDQGQYAVTSNMRLGDNGRQLIILATFSCSTLLTSDGNVWTRWFASFAGGLVMTLGAHDLLYAGNDQSATEFASRMQDGEPIGLAWLEFNLVRGQPERAVCDVRRRERGRLRSARWNNAPVTLLDADLARLGNGCMCWSTWN